MGGNCRDCAHYDVCVRSGEKCGAYLSAGVVSGALEGICLFNEGVGCENHERCSDCGWNPREIERRKQEIRYMADRGETPHVSVQARDRRSI